MRRDVAGLEAGTSDLLIIGGGVFGAAAAWEAASRGLRVSLVERGDFCQATSSQHFKVVHGGIRYLQHGDVVRVRESSRERTALLRIAPHLVAPLPIAMPAYGHGLRGRGVLRAGFLLYDLLTLDRNRGITDAERRIPRGRLLGRQELLREFGGLEASGLTGGALFHDGQIYNPPRLVLAFLRSAAERGARIANYVEVGELLHEEGEVRGVRARDLVSGRILELRSRVVLNATGPWAAALLKQALDLELGRDEPAFSRDLALVVRRSLSSRMGIACPIAGKDADALLDRGGRHLFLLPWRGVTLVGVWHQVHHGAADAVAPGEAELAEFIGEANRAYPGLHLRREDVLRVNAGLTLFGPRDQSGSSHSFGKRSLLIDHAAAHGIEGLVTLVGVRATTARGMGEKSIDLVCRKLSMRTAPSRTAWTPLYGGDVGSFRELTSAIAKEAEKGDFPLAAAGALAHNHGSRYLDVLQYGAGDPALRQPLPGSTVLGAEIIHAAREEMAVHLADVVMRRTDLGTAGSPGDAALEASVRLLANELGWDAPRIAAEMEMTRAILVASGVQPANPPPAFQVA